MNTFIVKYKKPIIKSRVEYEERISNCGGRHLQWLFNDKFEVVELDEKNIVLVENLPDVDFIEKNSILTAGDINYSHIVTKTYAHAHQNNYKGEGVTVAIIDSGINYAHENLPPVYKGCFMYNSTVYAEYLSAEDDISILADDQTHGTNVAGIIFMQGLNEYAHYVGVAPNANLMVVKANWGDMTIAHLSGGIEWAVDNGADVINISYHHNSPSLIMEAACEYAYSNNVSVVWISGNYGDTDPAELPGALTDQERVSFAKNYLGNIVVAAVKESTTDPSGVERVSRSSYGQGIDFSAPTLVATTSGISNSSIVATSDGTSFSAPYVTGMIAIIRQRFPSISVADIRNFLVDSSVTVGYGEEIYYGHGLSTLPDLSEVHLNYETDPVAYFEYRLNGTEDPWISSKTKHIDLDYITWKDFTETVGGLQPSTSYDVRSVILYRGTAYYSSTSVVETEPSIHATVVSVENSYSVEGIAPHIEALKTAIVHATTAAFNVLSVTPIVSAQLYVVVLSTVGEFSIPAVVPNITTTRNAHVINLPPPPNINFEGLSPSISTEENTTVLSPNSEINVEDIVPSVSSTKSSTIVAVIAGTEFEGLVPIISSTIGAPVLTASQIEDYIYVEWGAA